MILRRFYDEKLAQASWMIGCSGEALVVDPARDVEPYLRAAEEERVRITRVTETHIHADFVSGARELAARTGAQLLLSGEGGADWSYGYDATPLHDGDEIRVGNVRIGVMHTPGHTPEHLSFAVTDGAADAPMGVLTGDFVFVGDVGRPDLLERAASQAGTMEAGARTLFRSLRRFAGEVPDFVQIWPGHGAGSACGKALSAIPTSTLGYEKRFNWAFRHDDEDGFAAEVLAGQPEPPMYFARMKAINRDGPPLLGELRRPARIDGARLGALLAEGATVVDTRPAAQWARGHLPGTLSVPLGKSFATWAGSVLPYDRPFYLVVDEARVDEAVHDLAAIGLDAPGGYATPEVVDARAAGHGTLADADAAEADELRAAGTAEIVDVRNGSEWAAGHIPGSRNLPLGRLAERIGELPRDRPLLVHCQSGARAGVAISLLKARGFGDVRHLAGDWAEWSRAGREVEVGGGESGRGG
ncbi:MAG TPA: MBL fold metallo-hydrolase [Longimicrobium sp.]|nr:MBL fold metallo-hydrolase [Longimicrobium sp.]